MKRKKKKKTKQTAVLVRSSNSSFHIAHNAPCLPPKNFASDNPCFQFLLGITFVPREIKVNGYAKFWAYSRCNTVYIKKELQSSFFDFVSFVLYFFPVDPAKSF